MANESEISAYLQAELERRGLVEVPAVVAAAWLDAAGLLRDSNDRPGRELRRLLRDKKVIGAQQEANGRWFIERHSASAR